MKLKISQELDNQNLNQLLNRPGRVQCQNFIKIGWKLKILWTFEFCVDFLRSQNFSDNLSKLCCYCMYWRYQLSWCVMNFQKLFFSQMYFGRKDTNFMRMLKSKRGKVENYTFGWLFSIKICNINFLGKTTLLQNKEIGFSTFFC